MNLKLDRLLGGEGLPCLYEKSGLLSGVGFKWFMARRDIILPSPLSVVSPLFFLAIKE